MVVRSVPNELSFCPSTEYTGGWKNSVKTSARPTNRPTDRQALPDGQAHPDWQTHPDRQANRQPYKYHTWYITPGRVFFFFFVLSFLSFCIDFVPGIVFSFLVFCFFPCVDIMLEEKWSSDMRTSLAPVPYKVNSSQKRCAGIWLLPYISTLQYPRSNGGVRKPGTN